MAKKHSHFFISLLSTIVLVFVATFAFSSDDVDLYITNNSGSNKNLSYFSNDSGKWIYAKNSINDQDIIHARMRKLHRFNTVMFDVAVGNKLKNFYCTATISSNTMTMHTTIEKESGNCRVDVLSNHKLALIIDSPKLNVAHV